MQGFFASFAGKQIESFAAATYNDSMVENIKQIIAEASRELFNSNGYQKVTMRQIADRCGISVGNLTYHYPTVECAFLYRILNDPPVAALYADVINVPSLRKRYHDAHYRLYLHFCPEAGGTREAWISTLAMSALEYEYADVGILAETPQLMEDIFRAKLLFEGRNPEEYGALIHEAVEAGTALAKQLNHVY